KPPYVPSSTRVLVTRVAATVPLLIGVVTLLEYSLNVSFGIDQLMFRDAVIHRGGPFPGRISPASAIEAMLLALSFVMLDAGSSKLRRFSHWPALVAAALSFVAVLGYLYGAQQLYQIRPYASVAVHTGLVIAALGLAFAVARPDRNIARELFSQHHG